METSHTWRHPPDQHHADQASALEGRADSRGPGGDAHRRTGRQVVRGTKTPARKTCAHLDPPPEQSGHLGIRRRGTNDPSAGTGGDRWTPRRSARPGPDRRGTTDGRAQFGAGHDSRRGPSRALHSGGASSRACPGQHDRLRTPPDRRQCPPGRGRLRRRAVVGVRTGAQRSAHAYAEGRANWWSQVGVALQIRHDEAALEPDKSPKMPSLAAPGLIVVQVGPAQLRDEPLVVIQDLRAAHRRARQRPPPDLGSVPAAPAA